ncbi:hypothetical protein [Undibacterium fentianense]|uniref:Uncharacterized protein n=1 Tax=Undibacterium fentianense TaxID=2828728 RepID=A0A941IFU7_9BURK|nr:hypothetical protein [Undibacterium fentianense]MBR7799380.1 hypothetical protein [Undibacterium fentianense]
MSEEKSSKPMHDTSDDGSPKFGRLLLVLLFAVALIVVITFATEAYHTR